MQANLKENEMKPSRESLPEEPNLLIEEEKSPAKKKFPLIRLVILLAISSLVFHLFESQAWLSSDGVLRAKSLSLVNAPASGILIEIRYRKGDSVNSGQTLALIESVDLKQILAEREMSLESVSHELKRLTEERKLLEKEAERERILYENGATPKRMLEAAEYALQANQGASMLKEKETASVKETVSFLQKKMDSLTLKAPVSGIIFSDPAEKQGSFLKEGEPLFEIADPSSFYIEVPVKEKDIQRIHVGDAASVRFDAISSESFKGEVTSVSPSAEEKIEKVFKVQQIVNCEIKLQNLPQDVRYGMKAKVRIWPQGQRENGRMITGVSDIRDRLLNQNLFSAISNASHANTDTNGGSK